MSQETIVDETIFSRMIAYREWTLDAEKLLIRDLNTIELKSVSCCLNVVSATFNKESQTKAHDYLTVAD